MTLFGPNNKIIQKITLIAYPIAQNYIRICLGKYFTGIENVKVKLTNSNNKTI